MTDARLARLLALLRPLGRAAIAFSGGVDSSLLSLAARTALGGSAAALTADTAFIARQDLAQARGMAERLGIGQQVVAVDLLSRPEVLANGPDRCYRCKRALLAALADAAPGVMLLDGTNADDDPARPGRRALAELHVRSPLAEAGLTKADVRDLARGLGLPNAGAASNSCLATRIPQGVAIAPERLMRIEAMESRLRALGFENVRARDNDLIMIVEIRRADAERFAKNRTELTALAARHGVLDLRCDPRRP